MEGIQTSLFDDVPRFKIKNNVRLIELFAGIGAQAKALERLGVDFEHYRVCEFDRYAVRSYNAIHGTNFEPSDIRRWKGAYLGIEDTDKYTYILTYSFPCTDLSVAGKMQGMSRYSGTRSGLLWEVGRLLKETNALPQVLLMENVPQVCGGQNIRDFEEWLKFLEKLGYSNFYKILNAKDYGVPQNRERCYMVSLLGDYWYEFPTGWKLTKKLRDVLEDKVNEKYYLSDDTIKRIAGWKAQQDPLKHAYEERLFSPCITARGAGEEHSGMIIVTDKKVLNPPFAIDEQNKAIRTDGTVGTLTTDGSSPKHNNRVCDGYRIRKITPKECFRLMDFDDEDIDKCRDIGMSDSQLYKQAGNSICVCVLEAIFSNFFER